MTRAVIFDLDGTLVSLPVAIEEVRAEVAALFAGRGWEREMRPILETIDEAAAAVGQSEEEARELRARARGLIDRAEMAAVGDLVWLPGARALLDRLSVGGRRFAVVTNNSGACARAILGDWDDAVVIGRDDVVRPKPDPEGLLVALDRVGSSGGSVGAVWVGDRRGDVMAGLAARRARPGVDLEIVGVARSEGDRAALEEAGADWVIGEVEELGALGELGE